VNTQEVNFYENFLGALRQQGVKLPKTYKVMTQGLQELTTMLKALDVSPDSLSTAHIERVVMGCHFMCLVQDLNPAQYRQEMVIGKGDMERVIDAVALMHGVTFQDTDMLKKAEESLFARGGYWSPDKRPPAEIADLPKVWEEWLEQWADILGSDLASQQGVQDLGTRLAASAPAVSGLLCCAFDDPNQCLVHGDLKTANLLFATHSTGETAPDSRQTDAGVMLIDFQWTGVGCPAQVSRERFREGGGGEKRTRASERARRSVCL